MAKNILTALLVLALAAGGYALYSEIRGQRADLKALKETDEKAQAMIALKEKANVALLNENVKLRERDAAAEVVKARLRADLLTAQAEANKLREELRTVPPETLLAKTQAWLDTEEIELRLNAATQVEAVFSLAAFRLNADALADRAFLKFTLVPSLEDQLRLSDGQNALKASVIANDLSIIANKDTVIGLKDTQIVVRDDTIAALKHRNLWRTLGFIAGSFAIGYVIHGK